MHRESNCQSFFTSHAYISITLVEIIIIYMGQFRENEKWRIYIKSYKNASRLNR